MHRFSLLALALLCAAHPLFSQDARVLIIGLDGLRSDCLTAANTPALDGLIENGVFSPDALNNDITYSGPGWSAMVCGAGPMPTASPTTISPGATTRPTLRSWIDWKPSIRS